MSFRYIAPTRPLPPACRWLLQEGSAHLLWNAGCIAMVMRDRNGRWHTQIQWRMAVLRAPCGSQAQGMRWIERWMEKRGGLPGSGARREVRRPAWMGACAIYVESASTPRRSVDPVLHRLQVPAKSLRLLRKQ